MSILRVSLSEPKNQNVASKNLEQAANKISEKNNLN